MKNHRLREYCRTIGVVGCLYYYEISVLEGQSRVAIASPAHRPDTTASARDITAKNNLLSVSILHSPLLVKNMALF